MHGFPLTQSNDSRETPPKTREGGEFSTKAVRIEEYSQFQIRHFSDQNNPTNKKVSTATEFQSGYYQQKQKLLDFHNMIDRTQSIDTLATGMESNQSPHHRMASTTTDNIQPNTSAMFTMIEIERDKSIDTSHIRFEGGPPLQPPLQNSNQSDKSNAFFVQFNNQETIGVAETDNNQTINEDSSPIQSRSISMLQDQMFINLKKDEANLLSRLDKIQQQIQQSQRQVINPRSNNAFRGNGVPRNLHQKPSQDLLQALIINDSLAIDKICQLSREGAQRQSQKNEDDQPIEIYMDDQTIRDESMIGFRSKSVSPKSPLSNNRQIDEQVTNFDQYEHQLLIRQFRELRLQQQQQQLPQQQNYGRADSAIASFGEISMYPRTLSAGDHAQADQRTNNLFAFQNDSNLSRLLHTQGRAPTQVINQSMTSPRSANRKTVQFSDDTEHLQRAISISSPIHLQEALHVNDNANESGQSSSQMSARFEENLDEKQRVSSMNASAGKSGPGILSSHQQNKDESSSSDSFTSLSADIQNIISNDMPNAVLKHVKGNKIEVGPLGLARQATHLEKSLNRGGLPPLNQRREEDSTDLIDGTQYVGGRNMSENYMAFPLNDNYPQFSQQISNNHSRHGTLPHYIIPNNGQRQQIENQNIGNAATMSYLSNSNGKELEVESFHTEIEDNESFQKLRHPSDQINSPHQVPIDPYMDPVTGAKMSFMVINDEGEVGQQDSQNQRYFVPNPVTQYLFSGGSLGQNDKHSGTFIRNTPSFTNNYLDVDYNPQQEHSYGMQSQNLFGQRQHQLAQQQHLIHKQQYGQVNPSFNPQKQQIQANLEASQIPYQPLQKIQPGNPPAFFGTVNSSLHPSFQNGMQPFPPNSYYQQHQQIQINQFSQQQLQQLQQILTFNQSGMPGPQQLLPSQINSHHPLQSQRSFNQQTTQQVSQFLPPKAKQSSQDTPLVDNSVQRMNSLSNSSAHSGGGLPIIATSPQQSLAVVNQFYKGLLTEQEKMQYLIANAYILSKDQSGCRRLQKKIDEQIEKNHVTGIKFAQDMLDSLLPSIAELMMDSFANYLIQKLNVMASEIQIDTLFQNIRTDFVPLANNKHGTRALQNLFKQIIPLSEYRSKLISEGLKSVEVGQDKALSLSLNVHGNHVIQLCLDHLVSEEHKDGIFRTVILNCAKIATDKHGCCVIQKILNFKNSYIQRALVNVSLASLGQLINDQFGNYVVQQILKYNDNEITFKVAEFICENLTYYCTQKISSNVVESAVRSHSSPASQMYFYQFLLKNFKIFREIICDQYGNYVIHAILQTAKDHQNSQFYPQLFNFFNMCQDDLNQVSFGKKLITKIQSLGIPPADQMPPQIEEEKKSSTSQAINDNPPQYQRTYERNQEPNHPQHQSTFQKIKGGLKSLISGAAQHRGYNAVQQHSGGFTQRGGRGGYQQSTTSSYHYSEGGNNSQYSRGDNNGGGNQNFSHHQQPYSQQSYENPSNHYSNNQPNNAPTQAYGRHREVTNNYANNMQSQQQRTYGGNNSSSRGYHGGGNSNNNNGYYYQGGAKNNK